MYCVSAWKWIYGRSPATAAARMQREWFRGNQCHASRAKTFRLVTQQSLQSVADGAGIHIYSLFSSSPVSTILSRIRWDDNYTSSSFLFPISIWALWLCVDVSFVFRAGKMLRFYYRRVNVIINKRFSHSRNFRISDGAFLNIRNARLTHCFFFIEILKQNDFFGDGEDSPLVYI